MDSLQQYSLANGFWIQKIKKFIDGSQQLDFVLIVDVCEEKDGTVIKLCVMVPDWLLETL